ncbi:MAG: Calx-beta domain-containing protein [Limisphaerales bacterium]
MSRVSSLVRGVAIGLATCVFAQSSNAVPYASNIQNDAGTISFRLNESADNVKIVLDNGAATTDLGPLGPGLHSFFLGSATSYQIEVTKSGSAGWSVISDDNNPLLRFYAPLGIAVNNNPQNLELFGRIYVATSIAGTPAGTTRTTGKGIYVLNPDHTDALGTGNLALTGGITFAPSANSPFKIEVGEDNNLYIGDYSDANANVYRTDPNVSLGSGTNLLHGIGNTSNTNVHTTCNGSPIVRGSLANGNLTLWAIDGQWPGWNRLLRWNIGSGPIPHNQPPTVLGSTGNIQAEQQSDLDRGPDGKLYTCQFRTSSDASDLGALRVFSTDGSTVLWGSRINSPSNTELFLNARALKVSPDGKTLALIRNDTQTWLIGLTNGIPDLSRTNLLNSFGTTSATVVNRREVSWDAAGNLYVASTSHERVRVWSPGGYTRATTKSDGTFEVTVPPTVVSVTATAATASESGPVIGTFTLTRVGNLNLPLTVNYAVSGTASNGVDYLTLPGSVTFAAGASTTNITVTPIDDTISEFTETVILTLLASDNYGTITPNTATISIIDNDAPELVIFATQPELLESFVGARATFQIGRKGLLGPALTANLNYTGTATLGQDFNGPLTVTIPANAAFTNFNVTSIDDQLYEGEETIIANILAGSGYTLGNPASATAIIIDDELPMTTTLFLDRFDFPSSGANWIVNRDDGGSDTFAEFGYNYGNDGIPEAPNTPQGSLATRGLKFRVNETWGILNGLSVSPLNGNFIGDYRLRFDMWMNYAGPLNGGGRGSTEHISAGVGTTGNQAVWPSGNADGIWFTMSSDGDVTDTSDINADYGIFIRDLLLPPGSGAYMAGTNSDARGNLHPFYQVWGGVPAPAAQLAIRPWQTGVSPPGSMGMAWHTVTITKAGNSVSFDVDGRRIGAVDIAGVPISTNVFIGYHDWLPSVATNKVVQFGLVDNVRVESLTPPSGPTITQVQIAGSEVQIDFAGNQSDLPTGFTLQAASEAAGPYADVAASITQLQSSTFRATRLLSGPQQFYRIRRH